MTQTLEYEQTQTRPAYAGLTTVVYMVGLLLGLAEAARFYYLAEMFGFDLTTVTASVPSFTYLAALTVGPLLLISGGICGLARRRVAGLLIVVGAIILTIGSITQVVMTRYELGFRGAEQLIHALGDLVRANLFTIFAIAILRVARHSRRS